jgi:hypothetical protein
MTMATDRLIQRGDGVAFPRTNRVVNAATIDILDDEGFRIGYVTQVQETQSRGVTRVRGLNSLDAGRVIEQAPGVEDVNITINGYSLYDASVTDRGSLLHRMGGTLKAAKSLMGQQLPFNLVMRQVHPASGETSITRWLGCWVTNAGTTRSITSVVQVDSLQAQVTVRD